MKKLGQLCILLILFAALTPLNLSAQPGWVLYDDFESGTIDETKWSIDDSAAGISVVDGEAKFEHYTGTSGDSAWLTFPEPGEIKAIKVTVRVVSSSGSIRARIGAWTAQDEDGNPVWQSMSVRPEDEVLVYWDGVLDKDSYATLYKRVDSEMEDEGGSVIGQTYTFEMNLMPFEMIVAGCEEVGIQQIKLSSNSSLSDYTDLFAGIGTRSYDDDASMIVFFDDVYVLY